jgi:imidazolonepropionase-like amidohydrolase
MRSLPPCRAAESLRMQQEIGSLAPAIQADIIALDGGLLRDIAAVGRAISQSKAASLTEPRRFPLTHV